MKIYKGYELIKAIADGEIKSGSRFKLTTKWNKTEFVSGNVISYYKDLKYEAGATIPAWAIINGEFELIEDEVDIDNIEELECEESWTEEGYKLIDTVNELVQAVKQLNKEIKSIKEK